MKKFKDIEGTDKIDEAITNAASVITDEYFRQNGMDEIADNHDDEWYDLQEEIRANLLNAAFGIDVELTPRNQFRDYLIKHFDEITLEEIDHFMKTEFEKTLTFEENAQFFAAWVEREFDEDDF